MSNRVSDFKAVCQDATNFVEKEVKSVSHYLSRTVKKLDGYDRVFKLATGLGDFATYFTGPNVVYSAMRVQFKGVNEIVSPLHVITRIKEWSVKENRDKILKDWKETAKIGTLTVANTLDTIKFMDTLNFIRLGQIASMTCRLPFFGLVTLSPITLASNICIIFSSSFSLMQQPKKLADAARDLKKADRDLLKEEKWNVKIQAFNELKVSTPDSAKIQKLKTRYTDLCLELELMKPEDKRQGHSAQPNNWAAGAITIFNQKWTQFVKKASALDKDSPEVARWSDKADVWTAAKEVHENMRKKGWATVANDLAKIAIISFSIIGMTLLGATSAPVTIAFLGTGLATGAIGYYKFLIDDWVDEHKSKIEDKIAASVQAKVGESMDVAKKRKLATVL